MERFWGICKLPQIEMSGPQISSFTLQFSCVLFSCYSCAAFILILILPIWAPHVSSGHTEAFKIGHAQSILVAEGLMNSFPLLPSAYRAIFGLTWYIICFARSSCRGKISSACCWHSIFKQLCNAWSWNGQCINIAWWVLPLLNSKPPVLVNILPAPWMLCASRYAYIVLPPFGVMYSRALMLSFSLEELVLGVELIAVVLVIKAFTPIIFWELFCIPDPIMSFSWLWLSICSLSSRSWKGNILCPFWDTRSHCDHSCCLI